MTDQPPQPKSFEQEMLELVGPGDGNTQAAAKPSKETPKQALRRQLTEHGIGWWADMTDGERKSYIVAIFPWLQDKSTDEIDARLKSFTLDALARKLKVERRRRDTIATSAASLGRLRPSKTFNANGSASCALCGWTIAPGELVAFAVRGMDNTRSHATCINLAIETPRRPVRSAPRRTSYELRTGG